MKKKANEINKKINKKNENKKNATKIKKQLLNLL